MDLHYLPLHKLHKLRLTGEITTVQITNDIINRIKKYDHKLNCFLSTNFEQALKEAEKADKSIKQGETIDYFTAMPMVIKDIFNIKGTYTTCGSKILENYKSPYDATIIKKLKKLKATFIGKSNLDEFAMGSSTEHSAYGATKNPWNNDFVPGGSSGGSAAAIAAGLGVAAIGTDTGGSIRQPAGFCGVVGLKPTYGTVSRYGMVAYGSSLDQGGPITRDVKDAAILLERISGYDPQDSTSINKPLPNLTKNLTKPIKGMKIGIIKDLDLSSCTNEVKDDFQNNLDLLKELGVIVVPVEIKNIKHVISTYYIIAMAEASSNLGRYDGIRYGLREKHDKLIDLYKETRNSGFGEEAKLRILMGTFVLSAGYYQAYYGKAKSLQAMIRRQFKKAFEKVDAIALPVAPSTAFKIGKNENDPIKMYLTDVFTVPANITGIPGITIPSGIGEHNLPISFQMVATHFAEDKLLQLAYAIEKNRKPMPKLNI